MKPCEDYILDQIKRTWNTPYVEIDNGYIKKKFPSDVYEYDHTDGIGTKGIYHWRLCSFKNAVIDALAMNINDMLMMKSTPYKLQNHLTIPKDYQWDDSEKTDIAIKEIVTFLADECVKRDIAITGGETSIHQVPFNELLDISITMSGFSLTKFNNEFLPGDSLIGLPSSGIHSNGISILRKNGFKLVDDCVIPTRIYSLPDHDGIHGIQHITGGGFAKMKSKLKGNAHINRFHSLEPQSIFHSILKKCPRLADKGMYTTFNCGIGMILSVDQKHVKEIKEITDGQVIGVVINGTNEIRIESMFSNTTVEL